MAKTATGRLLTDRHRIAQAAIGAAVASRTLDLAPLLNPASITATQDRWLAEMLSTMDATHTLSTSTAVTYVNEFRTVEFGRSVASAGPVVTHGFDPVSMTAELATVPQMVAAATHYGADPWQAWRMITRNLAGIMMALAMRPGRRIVTDSAIRAGVGWRRVCDGNPCAWCAMLASRGPVYARSSALKTKAGRSYHPHCGCTCEEIRGKAGGWNPTPTEEEFIALYDKVHVPGMTGRDTAAAMRAAGQGLLSDAIKPQF
ncbi:MAG: hypothetical protein FWF25_02785 [Propionibacteriaceae bacterium]|nr:hypothetical protein [Propionibacteriaceae bacterium]